MKPTFALDLTRDMIALLHRTPKGWLSIGEVAFDAPDLDAALDYLRKTALGLSPMGVSTKIILPASQILYTEIHAPGPSRDDKRRQIAAGLEGRTPYPVEDLVFDWSGKGATVKVAVVARETLDEAEGFVAGHRLNPVSFVAIPDEGSFVGEPWFGPTSASATSLAPGETVDRDRDPVVILQRDPPPQDAPKDPDPVVVASAAEVDDPLPGLEDALNAELPVDLPGDLGLAVAPVAPQIEPEIDEEEDSLPGGSAMVLAEVATAVPPVAEDVVSAAAIDAPDADPVVAETVADTAPPPVSVEADEAPFAHVTDTAAFPETEDDDPQTFAARGAGAAVADDDIPPAPPSAAMVAFASRRSAPGTAPARPLDAPQRPDTSGAPRFGAPAARTPPAKGFTGLVTAPSIPGTRAKPKIKPPMSEGAKPSAQPPTTVRSPARPGGTFGTAAPPRNRSGVVFMVLVALLLLCLALIAAWSSFYLARNTPDGAATTELAADAPPIDVVPGVDDEMLADMQDPEGMTDPLPEADPTGLTEGDAGALATESLAAVDPDPAAINLAEEEATDLPPGTLEGAATDVVADAPEAEAILPVEPAPGTTVTTDLAVAAPPVEDQDEIFLSSMDVPPPALDALALPTPLATLDALPDTPMPPPAFGTVYQFDARGLLIPTAEGIISPDGVMLIAGKPPLVPPARTNVASEAARAAAAAAAAATPTAATLPVETALPAADASLLTADPVAVDPAIAEGATGTEVAPAPADPAMAGFRPQPRPEGLVPPAEAGTEDDARLATDEANGLATLRPLPRPATVVAAASASRPADAPEDALPAVADLGAQAASLTAQAEAQLAAAAALEAENPSIVAISMRPAARPRDLSRAVEAAVAAAVREPEPEAEVIEAAAAAPPSDLKPEELDEVDEPDTAKGAPSIPTKASVAKQATYANAINLSKINLIGTYGTDSRRYALVRQANGRYKKVAVGDKIDGGTVKAITDTEVRYQKGGKLLSLKMPKA